MPTYGYECKTCKHTFDAFQSMKDEPLKTCPKCGREIRRLINGGGAVIFKGNGFYVNDKNGGPSKSASSGSGSEGASCPGCAKSDTAACPKAVNS